MNNLSQIRDFLDSTAGKQMKDYLMTKTIELRNIDNIKEYQTPTTQALEVKAQLRAYNKLKEIMNDIMTFETDVKVKDPRDSYEVLTD